MYIWRNKFPNFNKLKKEDKKYINFGKEFEEHNKKRVCYCEACVKYRIIFIGS